MTSFIMAVDPHTGDTSLPSQFLPDKLDHDILSRSQECNHCNDNNKVSALKPQVLIPHEFGSHGSPLVHSNELRGKDKDDDFIAELTRQMEQFMLQDEDKFDFSGIGSENLESPWDLIGSPQSTLWLPLGSNQGSPEGSSQEPSSPAAPENSQDSCWESTYDVQRMIEKMKLDERGNPKYHPGYGIQSLKTSNVGLRSYQALIQKQIRAIQLSRLKQEQVLSLKRKATAYRESHGQISHQFEPKEQIQQFQKKGKGGGVGSGNGRRTRPPPQGPAPLQQLQSHRQGGSEMRALFLGGSGSRGASCGTGVYLPRGGTGTTAPSESRKKPGKGCSNSTVLIPARVVQALQLHFDQTAATSGPKAGGFPPLHDVLVSNRDGMYSLQKRQSRKAPSNIQNEMILPQEWTY